MPVVTIGDNTGDDYAGNSANQIKELYPNDNYSTLGTMETTHWAADNDTHVVIRFQGLSNIPSSATVNSATMSLGLHADGGGDFSSVSARRLLRGWVSGQVTWNIYSSGNSWAVGGGEGSDTDRVSTPTKTGCTQQGTSSYYDWTGLGSDVQGFVDGTYPNDGWHMDQDNNTTGVYLRWHTDDGTDGLRPYLTVDYTDGVTVTGSLSLGLIQTVTQKGFPTYSVASSINIVQGQTQGGTASGTGRTSLNTRLDI